LSASPQLAESIRAAKRFRVVPKGDIAAWHDCKRLKLKKLAPVPLKKVPLDLQRKVASLSLHLDRSPVLLGGPGGDHQVTPRALILAAHQLTDRPDRVDDGRARRIRHEALQRLERAAAGRLARQRQHVRLSRL